jgi:hypothetical protein
LIYNPGKSQRDIVSPVKYNDSFPRITRSVYVEKERAARVSGPFPEMGGDVVSSF